MKNSIDNIAKEDGRYHPNAVKFVYEALGTTNARDFEGNLDESEPHHISGSQLCLQLAKLAAEKWGRLAKPVLNKWGINNTRDFGEIVYMMIKHGWMSAQPTDKIEDFDNVYDFKSTFESNFQF